MTITTTLVLGGAIIKPWIGIGLGLAWAIGSEKIPGFSGRCTCGATCNCTPPELNGPTGWPSRDGPWNDSQKQQFVCPLILDLNRDGNLGLNNAAFFDLDANDDIFQALKSLPEQGSWRALRTLG